jgi:hypothetical protein
MEQGGVFSLNFLDTEQEDLARRFTEPLEPGDGAVGGSAYTTGETGAPLFEEAFAHLECRVVGKMEAGTTPYTWARSPPRTSAAPPTSSQTSTPPWSTGAEQPSLKIPATEADKGGDGTRLRKRGERGRGHRGEGYTR